MHFVKFKRGKAGLCNLCLRTQPLTWDHVPPKGTVGVSERESRSIFGAMTQGDPTEQFPISQSGVKYRTLCADCNNRLLGAELDPIYAQFARDLGLYLKSRLSFPAYVAITTRPQRLARAVFGHIVAANADVGRTHFDDTVRGFIHDFSQPMPSSLNLHYWVYPHEHQVLLRDFGMSAHRDRFVDTGYCQLLKSFPIAFLASDLPQYDALPNLADFRDAGIDDDVTLQIRLSPAQPFHYPEWNGERTLIVCSSSTVASPYLSSILSRSRP